MVQAQVSLKNGGTGTFPIYIFSSRFIILKYGNYLTLYKIILCIGRKIIFFCHHNFMKKRHSELFKNEPENIP